MCHSSAWQMSSVRQTSSSATSSAVCIILPGGHSVDTEGFFADPLAGGDTLKWAGIHAVGIANNVNYGEAAIRSSIARLDEPGIPTPGGGQTAQRRERRSFSTATAWLWFFTTHFGRLADQS